MARAHVIEHGPEVHKLLVSFTPDTSQERYLDRLLSAASHGVAPVRVASASRSSTRSADAS